MNIEALKQNLKHIRNVARELYVFTNQLNIVDKLEFDRTVLIDSREKKLLNDAIFSLTNQLRILNNSIPELIEGVGFYKKLSPDSDLSKFKPKLIQVKYKPDEASDKISLVISENDKKDFIENLSKSNLTINLLKKEYSVEKKVTYFGKPNFYAKISNTFFRNLSLSLVSKGYFENLNKELRKMNSNFVVGTYVSMIFFTTFLAFILSIIFLVFLLFFDISKFPFIMPTEEPFLKIFLKYFWIICAFPFLTSFLMFIYPASEARSIGLRINQELPFATIHMSAIATSGVEPMSIFKIIIKSDEYKYTKMEFRKLINLVNFHGKDIVTALKTVARTTASEKLRDLLDGLATAITSGGSIHDFLDKHSESMLFDYKLERERYTKASETFMDIYISIAIAAPMIILMLFVILGSTGTLMSYFGLSVNTLSFLIIFVIILLNIGFLVFLRIKQPVL
jgi:pilus assembly protein TadC